MLRGNVQRCFSLFSFFIFLFSIFSFFIFSFFLRTFHRCQSVLKNLCCCSCLVSDLHTFIPELHSVPFRRCQHWHCVWREESSEVTKVPLAESAQVIGCHGVKVGVGVHGEEGQEEDGEVRGEVEGEGEENQGQRRHMDGMANTEQS